MVERRYADIIEEKQRNKLKNIKTTIAFIVAIISIIFVVCLAIGDENSSKSSVDNQSVIIPTEIPLYNGKIYCVLNDNKPYFEMRTLEVFEKYGELDNLGRCTYAFANVCKETMSTEKRGEIGQIKPSGWNQAKYPGVIDSEPPYLYNRCHLIGYQLTAENANERNLITGTRYFNVEGMLPFENMIREYVDYTNNHVLYRVTPIYAGSNLLANGVIMEAYSVEDNGKGISFNVFVFNIQPGVTINYSDGSSTLSK